MRRRIIVMFHFHEDFSEDEVFDLLDGGEAFGCFADMFESGSIHETLSFHNITDLRQVSNRHCKKYTDEALASFKHQHDNPIKMNNGCRYLFEFREPDKDRIEVLRSRLASAQRAMDGNLPSDASMAYSKVLSSLGLGTRTGVVVLLVEIQKGENEDALAYYSTVTSIKSMLVDPEISLKGHFFLFGALRAEDIKLEDAPEEDFEDKFDFEYIETEKKLKHEGNVVYFPKAGGSHGNP